MTTSAEMKKTPGTVGLVGVGTMGKCMLGRLIEGGYAVVAYDPVTEAMKYAEEKGAIPASSPFDLAEKARLVIMSLPAARHIFEVIRGKEGLIGALTAGHVLVDTSTVSPGTSREAASMIAEKGAKYVDAPILGRPGAAGNWLMPAGGEEEAIAFVTPALLAFAKKIVRVGGVGAGNAIKLLNQLMFSVINGVSAEVMAVAEAVGVDKKVFYEVVANSEAATVSGLFKETAGRMITEDYDQPTFTIDLLCKDAGLGIQMANEAGVTPLIAGFVQMLNENARGKGLGKKDTSSLIKVFQEHFQKIHDL